MVTPQDKGRKNERRKEDGVISIPLSGAGHLKEDRKSEEFLIQDKLTTKKSYTLNLADLEKLEREAALVSRTPRFDIFFEENRKTKEYVILTRKDFEALCLTI